MHYTTIMTGIVWWCLLSVPLAGQHNITDRYVYSDDSLVLKKLGHWQDIKFGLLMHWGPYSQWGVVESWSICPEDEEWTQRRGPYGGDYNAYKKAYENLQLTFNPVDFNPSRWADAAAEAGMKYVVFTTKHHDGFCMFDTKETDYKITSPKTPFSKDPRRNITDELFKTFRNKGFMIGAYFSKPDWHNENYWWPYFPPSSRNMNYNIDRYPDRWKAFKQYTYNQIKELTTGYGDLDILWLDGGWVRPNTPEENNEIPSRRRQNQDIDMPSIARMARANQPGILVVDRTVGGIYENYETPEQSVPDHAILHPWESCMTMGESWSYVPGDHYKSTNTIIHTLIKIVARGGNLLLNIGPSPKGEWSDTAYQRLVEIGAWMQVNGEAIYHSRPLSPYEDSRYFYTCSKNGKANYLFLLSGDQAPVTVPDQINLIPGFIKGKKKITLVGSKETFKIRKNGEDSYIQFTDKQRKSIKRNYAIVIKAE